jgi:hypothetical protein
MPTVEFHGDAVMSACQRCSLQRMIVDTSSPPHAPPSNADISITCTPSFPKACCSIPPVVGHGYKPKGVFEKVGDFDKVYKVSPETVDFRWHKDAQYPFRVDWHLQDPCVGLRIRHLCVLSPDSAGLFSFSPHFESSSFRGTDLVSTLMMSCAGSRHPLHFDRQRRDRLHA